MMIYHMIKKLFKNIVELYVLINFYVMLFTIIILTVVYAKNVQEFIVRMCEQNRTFILTRVKRMCILSTLHFCFFFTCCCSLVR